LAYDKARFRMERAARYEMSGMPDAEIAAAIGITPQGLAVMKTRQEYKDLRSQIMDGLIIDMDYELGQDIKSLKLKVATSVPAALQTLVDMVEQRKDPALAFKAAESLIKMDGRFNSVNKVEVEATVKMARRDDEAVDELIAAQAVTSVLPESTDSESSSG
jgi:hypothetical protein